MNLEMIGSERGIAVMFSRTLFVITDQRMRAWPFAIVPISALLILILLLISRRIVSVRRRRTAFAFLFIYLLLLALVSIPSAISFGQLHDAVPRQNSILTGKRHL